MISNSLLSDLVDIEFPRYIWHRTQPFSQYLCCVFTWHYTISSCICTYPV